MKKILLAGGAGDIGTELCKRLQRLDYKVTVIDELWFGNNLNPKVELIQKDLLQVTHNELKGFDTVIFLVCSKIGIHTIEAKYLIILIFTFII